GIRLDRARYVLCPGRRLECARTEEHDHLVVSGLHSPTRHLAVRHRKGRLARQRWLVPRPEVGRRRFPPVWLGWHDDAIEDRRFSPAMQQPGAHQAKRERGQPRAAPAGHAQNHAPKSATVWAMAQGRPPPVTARRPPRARPTASSSAIAPPPERLRWLRANTTAPTPTAPR